MQLNRVQRMLPTQGGPSNTRTTPQNYPRTVRTDYKRVLTTGRGGQLLPIFAVPLLREDRLLMSNFSFSLEMAETGSMLMNPVRIAASVFLVPKLAFERFKDLGALNRSWMSQPEADNNTIPWFNPVNYWDGGSPNAPLPFYKTMGLHCHTADQVNSDYVEAYNAIFNYMAEEVSPGLSKRTSFDTTIAPAFWAHSAMRHVKPTFDQALIHGAVPINTATGRAVISAETHANANPAGFSPAQNDVSRVEDGRRIFDNIWAELNQASISLADIEMARKTASFARARQAYQGLKDDQLIDVLMSGVRLPEEGMKQPILLGRRETVFGMSQRYATDAGNLDKSVTRGQTVLDVNCVTPQVNTSGIVMGVVEILPEQLFERQRDAYLTAGSVSHLPDRLRDELDVEPVQVVSNKDIDTGHTAPTGVFGYAPLNHLWQRQGPNIGGRFHKPDPSSAWTEDRNRIWAVETVDPKLGDDFYLASNIHHNVFADSNKDPFEISMNANCKIEGLTFFGPALRESHGDYEKIDAKVGRDRIPNVPRPTEQEEE